jgi:hypothetical protein
LLSAVRALRVQKKKTYCSIILCTGPRVIRLDPKSRGNVWHRNIFNWPERNAHRLANVMIL